jgi:hypothetical protein
MKRGFLAALALALAAGCGSNGDAEADAAPDPIFSVENDDDSRHLHGFDISCGEIVEAAPQTYLVGNGHDHLVMVSSDDFMTLAEGGSVVISFTDGHDHHFPIDLPPELCPPP